ncbi:hypothetical protein VOLCADRAFT_127147 [Volvox carteri f. nagariensis]|uniref:Upf4 n=1 Tax=Volvox carteri f. nagariensis TaxID=3068 RepID=A1YQZ5_VOLCA|nr:uncharacterized protein VOLCADRAFT_127147 [Volvox carteri f. nagariensis]ABM47327.1 Upf4 [Volvox carteri f. nagariensis]EFJ52339.1 hypothetical protein VOLCADRAFT_127147 [Volvox carteri f. nagariensis]|eukprot:XP_002946412.1 hypothetical protein VOLCADRAFT_127147 [Volvox carteri f. nagariensis]
MCTTTQLKFGLGVFSESPPPSSTALVITLNLHTGCKKACKTHRRPSLRSHARHEQNCIAASASAPPCAQRCKPTGLPQSPQGSS